MLVEKRRYSVAGLGCQRRLAGPSHWEGRRQFAALYRIESLSAGVSPPFVRRPQTPPLNGAFERVQMLNAGSQLNVCLILGRSINQPGKAEPSAEDEAG